jgi:protein gp37
MFPFVTGTINPVKALCRYECEYCWARELILKRLSKMNPDYARAAKGEIVTPDMRWIRFPIGGPEQSLNGKGPTVYFVSDMCDLFGPWIERRVIMAVFREIKERHKIPTFLFLTKNPARYHEFKPAPRGIPSNAWLGATIETNRSTTNISKAPEPKDRFIAMQYLTHQHKFLSIEPIMDFDPAEFAQAILNIHNLEAVAIGYDNYGHHLPEPTLEKTEGLIRILEISNIKVFRKTIRKAWSEQ